ncbi:MAG: tetratricopeptide repeat protein [Candidatus Thalassarchaeaceae archaeon]|nr:tetratricopeptide repeat protein [Candidatus Thalassarchaeaceae archaeon]
MAGPRWKNIYRLSDEQISKLDNAEEAMVMMEINRAESILLELLDEDSNCVPVLNNLAHLNGRHLSDFEKAIEYYEKVLDIEPDNAWARDERRRYQRYLTYD